MDTLHKTDAGSRRRRSTRRAYPVFICSGKTIFSPQDIDLDARSLKAVDHEPDDNHQTEQTDSTPPSNPDTKASYPTLL
jgi:hypothetical protein